MRHHCNLTALRSRAYLVSPAHPRKIGLPLWGRGKRQERESEREVWELQCRAVGRQRAGQERRNPRREKGEGSQA